MGGNCDAQQPSLLGCFFTQLWSMAMFDHPTQNAESFMKTLAFLISLSLALLTPLPANAQEPGDWVLAQWRGGQFWFPGVVQARSGNTVSIAYDDGTQENLPVHLVQPYTWRVGTRVECQWAGGDEWYGGQITQMGSDGSTINVLYDDGDRETTRTGACRSR